MRDARQKRSIARLDRAGKVKAVIDRFPAKDHEDFEYLFNTHQILELTFTSHVQTAGERISYIADLLTNYFRGDLSGYTHYEALFTTSPEHPVVKDEFGAIKYLLGSLYDSPKIVQMRCHTSTDQNLGPNLKLYLVLSE